MFELRSSMDGWERRGLRVEEYKGIGGGSIIIDGNSVKLKWAFIKEECNMSDIIRVKFTEPVFLKNGSVEIFTTKNNQAPFSLVFSKSKRDIFYEIYDYLDKNTLSASRKEADKAVSEHMAQSLYQSSYGVKTEKELLDEANALLKTSKADNTPKCPKCRSTSISANQKGFGVGKAVVGAAFAGPIGIVAGNLGAIRCELHV